MYLVLAIILYLLGFQNLAIVFFAYHVYRNVLQQYTHFEIKTSLLVSAILYSIGFKDLAIFALVYYVYTTFMEKFTISNSNLNVVIYKRDTCPYCHQAMDLTKKVTNNYTFIDLNDIDQRNDEMYRSVSNLNYIPLIFVNGTFIGSLGEYRRYLTRIFPDLEF
jgi:glutaredoxin 3